MNGETKTTRIYYLEVLRALAAVAVVVIHVASNNWYGNIGSPAWTVFTIYAGLVKFCVPVFFMISGALFLEHRKKLNIKRLFCHNILRLVIFLLIWSFIYQLYQLVFRQEPASVWAVFSEAFSNIVNGNTQVHLWFLYTMIGIYLVLPVVKVFTDGASKKQLEYFLLLWFLFQSVYQLICQIPHFSPLAVNGAKLGLADFGGYAGYFVLGHYLHQYTLSPGKRKVCCLLGAAGICISIAVTYLVSIRQNSCNEGFFGYFFPGVVLWSAAVFLFVKTHGERWTGIRKAVEAVSRYSFGIYGVHMLFLFLLWDHGISTFTFSAILSVPVLTAVIFLGSFVTSAILARIPGLRRFMV